MGALDAVVVVGPALPRLVQDVVQHPDVLVPPQGRVAVAHGLERVEHVRQRLPLAPVHDAEEVLVEEEHVGHVGMRVHGVDQEVILLLRGPQDDGAAVQQVVVVGARLGDGRGLARLLVCGGEGAVLGYPVFVAA